MRVESWFPWQVTRVAGPRDRVQSEVTGALQQLWSLVEGVLSPVSQQVFTSLVSAQAQAHLATVVVYYCRTYEKAVSGGGEREKGGHVLRDTTSRGLYVRVWPPHTSERRGGGGGCEQEGWQGGEGRARMSGQEERQRHIRRC